MATTHGKKHLNYKYNLRSDLKKHKRERSDFTRYYYPFSDWKSLINHIVFDKKQKLDKLGEAQYKDMMNFERATKKNQKGFWQESWLV